MKLLTLATGAYGLIALFSLSPLGHARAQSPMATVPATSNGNWTLRQREEWLNDRLDRSLKDGSIDRAEYARANIEMSDLRRGEDQMRDSAHGQLTDNQTADLKIRLDAMAARIHWANMTVYTRPW